MDSVGARRSPAYKPFRSRSYRVGPLPMQCRQPRREGRDQSSRMGGSFARCTTAKLAVSTRTANSCISALAQVVTRSIVSARCTMQKTQAVRSVTQLRHQGLLYGLGAGPCNDPDKDSLLKGIQHGFDIVDPEAVPNPVDTNKSALPGTELYEEATQQILTEIECGNYIVCKEKPAIISPLSVLHKPGWMYSSYKMVASHRRGAS